MSLNHPAYSPHLQREIDKNAADIRDWLDEISPATLEWMREDRFVVQLIRAAMSDVLYVQDAEGQRVRALAWVQFLMGLGA